MTLYVELTNELLIPMSRARCFEPPTLKTKQTAMYEQGILDRRKKVAESQIYKKAPEAGGPVEAYEVEAGEACWWGLPGRACMATVTKSRKLALVEWCTGLFALACSLNLHTEHLHPTSCRTIS